MIEELIIEKDDFYSYDDLKNRIYGYLKKLELKKKPLFVIDIHNTLEYNENEIDLDVLHLIRQHAGMFNVILLSFDGNLDRIERQVEFLNKYIHLQSVPKIFIRKRKKGLVNLIISIYFKDFIGFDKSYEYQMIFIDDNNNNIKDTIKYADKLRYLSCFNYSKHSKFGHEHDDFKELYDSIPFIECNHVFKIENIQTSSGDVA